ncbi:hypothetical protein EJB05_55115, partial [Eragrostis curvula]
SGYNWSARLTIIKGIADGLRYLHDNRAVHSNLKPSNILLDSNLRPKICDFGVARVGYSAPEFFLEEDTLTTMSDVYTFGVILLEIIKGMHEIVPDDPKDTVK